MKLYGYIFYTEVSNPVEIPGDENDEFYRDLWNVLQNEKYRDNLISGYLVIKEDD